MERLGATMGALYKQVRGLINEPRYAPETFQEWATINNELMGLDSNLSAESGLVFDIISYETLLREEPYDRQYLTIFRQRVKAMRLSERLNFNFIPEDKAMLPFKEWTRRSKRFVAYNHVEPGGHELYSRAVADYAETLRPCPHQLDTFMARREELATAQRRELNGLTWENHPNDKIHDRISGVDEEQAHNRSGNGKERFLDAPMNPFTSFKEWTEFENSRWPEQSTPINAEQTLRRDVLHYETNYIEPLGRTSEALAWYNLRHNVELRWKRWNFIPDGLSNLWLPIPTLQEYLQGRLDLMQPAILIFDEAWNGYAKHLQDLDLNRPDVLEEFKKYREKWIAGTRRELNGLPRYDPLPTRFRFMISHLEDLVIIAEDDGKGEDVGRAAAPARRLLSESMEAGRWPSDEDWASIRLYFELTYRIALGDKPHAPPFDFEAETRMPRFFHEVEELVWGGPNGTKVNRVYVRESR
jgi:hypothetical protein